VGWALAGSLACVVAALWLSGSTMTGSPLSGSALTEAIGWLPLALLGAAGLLGLLAWRWRRS
jgi:hypothetical protein